MHLPTHLTIIARLPSVYKTAGGPPKPAMSRHNKLFVYIGSVKERLQAKFMLEFENTNDPKLRKQNRKYSDVVFDQNLSVDV